jgi:hypothetical protein
VLPNESSFLIGNAGLVLTSPYLPRLWAALGLADDNSFKDLAASTRAAHLLDYLVFGDARPPVPTSALNRVLCGLPPTAHAGGPFNASTAEMEEINGLLAAMISHWRALRTTSASGLRQTFLQREAQLTHLGDRWALKVSPRAFDVLLNGLPWGFSVCKYNWMRDPLYVEWGQRHNSWPHHAAWFS